MPSIPRHALGWESKLSSGLTLVVECAQACQDMNQTGCPGFSHGYLWSARVLKHAWACFRLVVQVVPRVSSGWLSRFPQGCFQSPRVLACSRLNPGFLECYLWSPRVPQHAQACFRLVVQVFSGLPLVAGHAWACFRLVVQVVLRVTSGRRECPGML